MKIDNTLLLNVFVISCVIITVTAVESLDESHQRLYHVGVPSSWMTKDQQPLSGEGVTDDVERLVVHGDDDERRKLSTGCDFRAGEYTCLFDTALQDRNGQDVFISLMFNCDWDYSTGVDVRNPGCSCDAIVHPGTADEQLCKCIGCPSMDMMVARNGNGNVIDNTADFGVAVDCSATTTTTTTRGTTSRPGFVVDDCTTLDCSGECNGVEGLPWLSSVSAAVVDRPQEEEEEKEVVSLEEEKEKGEEDEDEKQVVASTEEKMSLETIVDDTVMEGTKDSITSLWNAAVLNGTTVLNDTMVSNGTSFELETNGTQNITNNGTSSSSSAVMKDSSSNVLLEDAIHIISVATMNVPMQDMLNAVGSHVKEEKIIDLAKTIENGHMSAEDLENTVIASNAIADETSVTADVFFYSVIDRNVSVDTVVNLADAISILVDVTDATGEEIIAAMDSGVVSIDEIIRVANDYNDNTIETNEVEDFVDAIRYIIDASRDGIDVNNIMDGLEEDIVEDRNDDDDFRPISCVEVEAAILYLEGNTDLDRSDLVISLNNGMFTIRGLIKISKQMEEGDLEGDNFNENLVTAMNEIQKTEDVTTRDVEKTVIDGDLNLGQVVHYADALNVVEDQTDLDRDDIHEGIQQGIIHPVDVIDLGDKLQNGDIEGIALQQFVDNIETIAETTNQDQSDIWEALLDGFGVNTLMDLLQFVTIIQETTKWTSQDVLALGVDGPKINFQPLVNVVDEINNDDVDINVFLLVLQSEEGGEQFSMDDIEPLQMYIDTITTANPTTGITTTDVTDSIADATYTLDDIANFSALVGTISSEDLNALFFGG